MTKLVSREMFTNWSNLKFFLHNCGKKPTINEGEIWWAAVGRNIGIEINGKDKMYSRPVLVLHKFSDEGFLAIPLTSQNHSGSWYTKFAFKGEVSSAALAQVRTMSVSRLYDYMGILPEHELERIRGKFIELYSKKIFP